MKNIIITGGARGLGFSIAKKCLEEGYRVIAISRKISDEAYELNENKNFIFIAHDFIDSTGAHDLTRSLVEQYGRPWGLINNAALGLDGVLGTFHESDIAKMVQVNVVAPIILTKYVSRAMLLQRSGRIINISSIIASTGFSGLSVYAATKAAMSGFTKSLARELGKANITVNTIAPGYMATDMTSSISDEKLNTIKRRSPLGKLISVEQVADFVVYLLSEKASEITGSTFTLDAGSTA